MGKDFCREVQLFWKGKMIFRKVFTPPVSPDDPKLRVQNFFDDYRAEWY